jgi:cytosine/adenosine deaminase-related metal-dependent hydrolase
MLCLEASAGRPSVLIDGDRVVDLGAIDGPPGARRLDCKGAEIEIGPGQVNAHTHLYSGLAPLGMPAPTPPPQIFLEILQRVWWRLDRALDEPSLRASARLYIAEALLAGTTTLIDHHESPAFIEGSLDVLAEAASELGIRMLVAYGATERNGGPEEASRGLAECRRFARANQNPRVRALVGLHASFTLSDETIREAGALAQELGTQVHVHVAEDAADVADAKKRGFAGPLERLLDLGGLPAGSILAHGVCLDDAQVRRAGQRGCWLVQNPRSNEGNRVGYPRALSASPRVAMGTDGYPADMVAEAAALRRLAREHGERESILGARLVGGLRLVGERFGRELEASPSAGSLADLVVRSPGQRPRHVLVGGEVVVENGQLVRGDLEEIRARAREEAAKLFRRMEALR